MNGLNAWMRDYFEIGWTVLPLRVTRDPTTGKKVPDFGGGFGWKDGPHTLADSLRRLSALGSRANALALLTGKVSGVTVIDGDGSQGIDNAARYIPNGTPTARTQSDGRHWFFEYTPALPTSANHSLCVDVRGDGGYIFVAPSRVDGGGAYSWINPPDHPLAPVPPSLVAFLRPESKPHGAPVVSCGKSRRLEELTAKQRYHLDRRIEQCARAEVGERSSADFALCFWAAKCNLAAAELWRLCANLSKFAERGREYFDRTFQAATTAATQ